MNDLVWAIYRYLLDPILGLLTIILLIWVIASWLLAFGVINQHNPNARMVLRFLSNICEPLCRPVRRIIPPIGGLDLSVLIVFLLLGFVRGYLLPAAITTIFGPPYA